MFQTWECSSLIPIWEPHHKGWRGSAWIGGRTQNLTFTCLVRKAFHPGAQTSLSGCSICCVTEPICCTTVRIVALHTGAEIPFLWQALIQQIKSHKTKRHKDQEPWVWSTQKYCNYNFFQILAGFSLILKRPVERSSSNNVSKGQEKLGSIFEVIHRRTAMKIKGRNEMASTVTPGHQERLNQAVIEH